MTDVALCHSIQLEKLERRVKAIERKLKIKGDPSDF